MPSPAQIQEAETLYARTKAGEKPKGQPWVPLWQASFDAKLAATLVPTLACFTLVFIHTRLDLREFVTLNNAARVAADPSEAHRHMGYLALPGLPGPQRLAAGSSRCSWGGTPERSSRPCGASAPATCAPTSPPHPWTPGA